MSGEYDLLSQRLHRNLQRLTNGAERLGLDVLGGKTPIISILVGDEERRRSTPADSCLSKGITCNR